MNRKAYTEVYRFIEMLPEELKRKIPDSLIKGIKNNMDTSYQFEIDDESLDDMELLEDTEKILSVIYTDYLASEDEKKIIKNKESSILKEKEQKKKENFATPYYNFQKESNNIENIDEKVNNNECDYIETSARTSEEETNQIIKIPKEKWYQKFIRIIKNAIHK